MFRYLQNSYIFLGERNSLPRTEKKKSLLAQKGEEEEWQRCPRAPSLPLIYYSVFFRYVWLLLDNFFGSEHMNIPYWGKQYYKFCIYLAK